jgi:membrane protein implicated in regulation of membrane protease activity
VITFAVTSTVLLVTVRPAAKRWATRNAPFVPTNVHALTGQRAETLTEVTHRTGSVKLTGETWSARTEQAGVVIPPGAPVEVVAIDGATAVVRDATPQDRSTLPPA